MKDVSSMKKEELVELVCEMAKALYYLEDKISKAKPVVDGRKEQVLAILRKESTGIEVGAIATRLKITARNVSSQLTYLRKDGYNIATTSTGKKILLP